jgi:hypothetical protein
VRTTIVDAPSFSWRRPDARATTKIFAQNIKSKTASITQHQLPYRKTGTTMSTVDELEMDTTMEMMKEDGVMMNDVDMGMTNATTTIDPSVVQSRIRYSASLAKEAQQEQTNDNVAVQQQQPTFPKLTALQQSGGRVEYRRVRCPPHRYTPLRENWEQILTPLVEYLKLQASITTHASRQSLLAQMMKNTNSPWEHSKLFLESSSSSFSGG